MTDTERLDFLQRQHFTRWVGYDTPGGWLVWPVFANCDLRASIDRAIEQAAKFAGQQSAAPEAGGDGEK